MLNSPFSPFLYTGIGEQQTLFQQQAMLYGQLAAQRQACSRGYQTELVRAVQAGSFVPRTAAQNTKENKQIFIERLQSISWIKRYLKGRWF